MDLEISMLFLLSSWADQWNAISLELEIWRKYLEFWTSNGLFHADQVEAIRGSMEARLAVSSLYLSSIGSLPFFPFTHHCFLAFCMICTIGSFPAHHPYIYLRFSALEPVLCAYTML
jgi:hypothetical protein